MNQFYLKKSDLFDKNHDFFPTLKASIIIRTIIRPERKIKQHPSKDRCRVIDITLLPKHYPRCPSIMRVSWITPEVKRGTICYAHQGEYGTPLLVLVHCQISPLGLLFENGISHKYTMGWSLFFQTRIHRGVILMCCTLGQCIS